MIHIRATFTTSGGFDNITKYLKKVQSADASNTLHAMGREGVESLKRTTPTGDTGQTAMGWGYSVTKVRNGVELSFHNNAHPQESVNIAKLIRLGHGTGTGGYVPPYDYITPALSHMYRTAGDRIAKELFR